MLVPLVDVIKKAWEEKYCVGAFAVYNLETALALRDAAVEMNSPAIAMFADWYFKQIPMETITAIMRQVAGESKVPIVLHLDHGQSIGSVMRAIKSGFTSVMYDGSEFSLKENVERTKMIVEIAHAVGVSVEGSVGEMPRPRGEGGKTDPEEAEAFTSQTGVDALAVSVGNVHEVPIRASIANLDFERLAEIHRRCKVPLVFHGGSGVSEDVLKKAIPLGLCKLNVVTCISIAMAQSMRQQLSESDDKVKLERLMPAVRSEMESIVKHYMRVLGSEGKA